MFEGFKDTLNMNLAKLGKIPRLAIIFACVFVFSLAIYLFFLSELKSFTFDSWLWFIGWLGVFGLFALDISLPILFSKSNLAKNFRGNFGFVLLFLSGILIITTILYMIGVF